MSTKRLGDEGAIYAHRLGTLAAVVEIPLPAVLVWHPRYAIRSHDANVVSVQIRNDCGTSATCRAAGDPHGNCNESRCDPTGGVRVCDRMRHFDSATTTALARSNRPRICSRQRTPHTRPANIRSARHSPARAYVYCRGQRRKELARSTSKTDERGHHRSNQDRFDRRTKEVRPQSNKLTILVNLQARVSPGLFFFAFI